MTENIRTIEQLCVELGIDARQLAEVCFMPDDFSFWTRGRKGEIPATRMIGLDCWDNNKSLTNELKEEFNRIVGREPACPPPLRPPHPSALLRTTFEITYFALVLAIAFGQVVPGGFWIAAICGGILMAYVVGLILWRM